MDSGDVSLQPSVPSLPPSVASAPVAPAAAPPSENPFGDPSQRRGPAQNLRKR
jgi:hypothetical protein